MLTFYCRLVVKGKMLQRGNIKIRDGMCFMTGQTVCVLERKAGRLASPYPVWMENWTKVAK